MKAAYVFFSNKEEMIEFPFYKSVPLDRKSLYRLKKLEHAEFVSYWTFFANTRPDASAYDTSSYRLLCTYTRDFFDKYLRGKNSTDPPLNANPELINELQLD
jgi:hypothetical protein